MDENLDQDAKTFIEQACFCPHCEDTFCAPLDEDNSTLAQLRDAAMRRGHLSPKELQVFQCGVCKHKKMYRMREEDEGTKIWEVEVPDMTVPLKSMCRKALESDTCSECGSPLKFITPEDSRYDSYFLQMEKYIRNYNILETVEIYKCVSCRHLCIQGYPVNQ